MIFEERPMDGSSDRPDASVTVVMVNYRTPELSCRCIHSLRLQYPEVPVIVVDNGSDPATVGLLERLAEEQKDLRLLCNPSNRGHGPALDQAVREADTELVLSLDSDVEVIGAGLIEGMSQLFSDPSLLAAGQLVPMNRYGYPASATARLVIPYVYPATMMLCRRLYLQLPPFQHHGSPCLHTMRAACERGLTVADFDVSAHVNHDGAGTCSRFGYDLGIRTSIEKVLSRLGLFE
jgi:glycosyltransferase involved in cell wall biosynthesis